MSHEYSDECMCDECEAKFREAVLENLIVDEEKDKEEEKKDE